MFIFFDVFCACCLQKSRQSQFEGCVNANVMNTHYLQIETHRFTNNLDFQQKISKLLKKIHNQLRTNSLTSFINLFTEWMMQSHCLENFVEHHLFKNILNFPQCPRHPPGGLTWWRFNEMIFNILLDLLIWQYFSIIVADGFKKLLQD